LGRLAELEAQLIVLKRELSGQARRCTSLPGVDFQALRVDVSGDYYGLPIASVLEIVRYVQLTRVSDVPDVVLGAINVRGRVYAVLDARRRFGYEREKPNQRTSIVLAETQGRTAGLVVDRVVDVVNVTQGSLSEPAGALSEAHAVAAISTVQDSMLQLVDLAMLLTVREWDRVDVAISEPPPGLRGGASETSEGDGGWE
jgi:purine-binding chemotaxis protein CheW